MARRAVLAITFLVLVSGVSAREPRPCCWIRQMTGQAEIQGTVKLDSGTVVFEESEYQWAYDATFQAQGFIFSELLENGTTILGRIINFYDRGVSFYVEDNQGQERCVRERIPARFPEKCIPGLADYAGNRTLGNEALLSHEWKQNTEVGGNAINTTYLIQDEYCVPISYDYVSTEPKIVTIAYGDIKLGICDRKKFFHVPDECPRARPGTSFGERANRHRLLMQTAFTV